MGNRRACPPQKSAIGESRFQVGFRYGRIRASARLTDSRQASLGLDRAHPLRRRWWREHTFGPEPAQRAVQIGGGKPPTVDSYDGRLLRRRWGSTVRNNRHDSVYLFVAICQARGVGATIVMPTTNTEAMNEHPKEISTEVLPGALAVLVSDGAGWDQQGKRVRMPHNITLLRPPQYSPELNSMQN